MKPSISTTSVLLLTSRITLTGFLNRHIHALPDEIVRHAFAFLDSRDRRCVGQVCARWHELASVSASDDYRRSGVYLLPWNVLKRVFSLLESGDLTSAAGVCRRWQTLALCFFSSRMGRLHVHDLPAEIVKRSFAFLDFDNLRYAAQVCVRWRDLGIEHPGFWKDIEVRSATAGALDLVSARVGQSNGRPCSFTIDIACLHPNICTRVLDLLMCVADSVQTLSIQLNSLYMVDLWRVLNLEFPQLVNFHLKLYSPDRLMPRAPINPWIFDNLPGRLGKVRIEDVLMPSEPIRAFSNLHTLEIMHSMGTIGPFPSYLLEWCPNLFQLTVHSGVFTPPMKFSAAALEGLSRLFFLNVHLAPHAVADFVAQMPMRDTIPIFAIQSPPDYDTTYDFLLGVQGPFNLGLMGCSPDRFSILVEDDRSGYQRILVEEQATYLRPPEGNDAANLLFENPFFPEQLLFMKISVSLWKLLGPYLSLYTVVPKLILLLNTATPAKLVTLPRDRLVFPSMHTLVLEADDDYLLVSAQEVIDFVDHVLVAPQCCNLELQRVTVYGSDEPLSRRFTAVKFASHGHSRDIVRKNNI